MTDATNSSPELLRTDSFRQHGSSPLDELIFRLRARRTLRCFPGRVESAADLGSGHDFRLLRHLYASGRIRSGVAVDLSLDRNRLTGATPLRLLEASLNEPLDLPDSSVDVVLSLAVIEHLERPDVHLAEAHRILRPGGLLLLTSPSPRSQPLLEFLAYKLHVIDAAEIEDHKQYFGERQLRDAVSRVGFLPPQISYQSFLLGMNQMIVAKK